MLFFLLLVWPLLSVILIGDPSEALRLISLSPILMAYLPTIVMQWLLFLFIYITVLREETGLAGIGFKRIRVLDFLYALGFLLVSNLLLTLIALALAEVGLAMPGELALLLPKNNTERVFWIILSITAGICEETAFRGYLLTRIRMFGRTKTWILPVILASISFGCGHTYQGVGGFILISIYGAMFSLLFIYTKSLWPAVIAHFFQDFSALFFPFQGQ